MNNRIPIFAITLTECIHEAHYFLLKLKLNQKAFEIR